MPKYQVLWIDDDWSISNEVKFDTINNIKEEIADQLLEINCKIEWNLVENFSQAFDILETLDVRLIILDIQFSNQPASTFDNCIKIIRKKKIPYIVFTQFPEQLKSNRFYNEVDYFRILSVQKGVENLTLIKKIKTFFKAPPFRILHLSDLHYNSKLIDEYKYEQDCLFDSLLTRLNEIHKESPINIIIITGDLAYEKPENDLIMVSDIVQELINKTITNKNIDHLFIIPGNHDLLWSNFKKKMISGTPWKPYLEFLLNIYNGHFDILKESNAWDADKRLFKYNSLSDDLIYHRNLQEPLLNIIGFVTPTFNKENQGNGEFSEKQKEIVDLKWNNKPLFGEIRIAIMHHNLYASLSLDRLDGQHILRNPGEAFFCLLNNHCNLVISGHTHSPCIFSSSAFKMNLNGFNSMGNIINISTGTAGGASLNHHRPCSFNIIDILDIDENTNKRILKILPYLYENTEHKWFEKQYCDLII